MIVPCIDLQRGSAVQLVRGRRRVLEMEDALGRLGIKPAVGTLRRQISLTGRCFYRVLRILPHVPWTEQTLATAKLAIFGCRIHGLGQKHPLTEWLNPAIQVAG
ncbi:MAG TPA: hypothetical protein VI699_07850 [Candidatus Acidoferrales bacterium]|nr:hypothetical protein [Candidatus Acidoferrales bacterium]